MSVNLPAVSASDDAGGAGRWRESGHQMVDHVRHLLLDRAARLNLAQGLSVIEGLRHEIGIVGNEEIHLPAEGFLSRRQLYAAAPELAPIPVDHEVDGFWR